MNTPAKNAYILFTDLAGFSKLSDVDLRIYYSTLLPLLAQKIMKFKEESTVWNTWGDSLIVINENEASIADLAFEYRDFFNDFDYTTLNIPPLYPRIACHFGRFDLFDDPLLSGKKNALGININTSARIEPITKPKEIFVTKEFKDRFEATPDPNLSNKFAFDIIGQVPLAKNFGTHELYKFRKMNEDKEIIDRILEQDLSKMLPEVEAITDDNKRLLNSLKNSYDADALLNNASIGRWTSPEIFNENFLLEIAKIYKMFGLYEQALVLTKKIKDQKRSIDGINISLLGYSKELMKLETNCLTRQGRYEEAANLIYGVWNLGYRDSNTLSMLAAQYKRRAIYGNNNVLCDKEGINYDLLKRALSLYIEAFRINTEDYYPAINVAYLYKIIGGDNAGKGIKFANYILKNWKLSAGSDWWIDSTLLECDIIIGDYENLDDKYKNIITKHKPNSFEKMANYTQIKIFSELTSTNSNIIDNILKMLSSFD
ncbi:hypothetical protein Mmc1_3119 [Magnetococcus marinus MC-1]|uniref:Guanylate cyclase domain-containing protein n=1 Tax=Magnetococcus marinus (strain ATCC BAA-1437 / JCM 17883 / MC-1) TaxID=156889 RepID=A0LCB6_MAGMM|nr:tetratricopeptide repeat-containing protein [Magnetococcus marinus]ABK45609.1 hypothetical protein Mmc1_3119 [Magnetococcus marinus MC-1]